MDAERSVPSPSFAAAPSAALAADEWRKRLSILRLGLATLCAGWAVAGIAGSAFSGLPAIRFSVWGAFAAYAVASLWRPRQSTAGHLPALFGIDAAFFAAGSVLLNVENWILFYFYLLLRAAVLHSEREMTGVLLLGTALSGFGGRWWSEALRLTLMFAGSGGLSIVLRHRALEDRKRLATLFRSDVDYAREIERQRIAHDFHDGPLQTFVGLSMRLEVVRKILDRDVETARRELADLQVAVQEQSVELRDFVGSMRPPEIDGAGLVPSIKKAVDNFERQSGIHSTFAGAGTRIVIPPDRATQILQIVGEALHNVHKHSGAKNVMVGIARDGDTLELCIEDDGTGFPFSGTFGLDELEEMRKGPVSIRSRVRQMNGDLLLDSQPDRGTALRIRIPA